MNLQHRVHELSDMDLKCSEINQALRQFKEKYDSLVRNTAAYTEEGDVAYLRRRIDDMDAKAKKMEETIIELGDKNKTFEETNNKLSQKVDKYKSDIKKIARILTQQEEIIKKYEVYYVV